MKTLMTLGFLLTVIILFPGCYTVLLVDDSTESVSIEPIPTSQPIVEYIPVYVPEPNPGPVCGPPPRPHPDPPTYIPTPVYVQPSTPPLSSDNHRDIHTGQRTPDSNPAPARNDKNNNGTRDSGVRRGGR